MFSPITKFRTPPTQATTAQSCHLCDPGQSHRFREHAALKIITIWNKRLGIFETQLKRFQAEDSSRQVTEISTSMTTSFSSKWTKKIRIIFLNLVQASSLMSQAMYIILSASIMSKYTFLLKINFQEKQFVYLFK